MIPPDREAMFLSIIYNLAQHVDWDELDDGIYDFLEGLDHDIELQGSDHKHLMYTLANTYLENLMSKQGTIH